MNLTSNNIRLLLVVGIAAMLMLFISLLLIFIFTQRKKLQYQRSLQALHDEQKNQLIEAAVRSEEIERHRIAEELHDEVGTFLSSAKLHFHSIKIEDYDKSSHYLHQKGKELLDEAIKKVRGISHSMHSSILQEFGLNEAIEHFAGTIGHESLIETTTDLDNSYPKQAVQNDISIYRILQEFMNNIIKHAHASKIRIKSVYLNKALMLTISHNGNGLTQEQFEELQFNKEGLGLKNIQNRVILLKGNLKFSQNSDGYYIDIYVPVN
jgi:two-component system NarL family sensor kinase